VFHVLIVIFITGEIIPPNNHFCLIFGTLHYEFVAIEGMNDCNIRGMILDEENLQED
jgi:hypothetical protein